MCGGVFSQHNFRKKSRVPQGGPAVPWHREVHIWFIGRRETVLAFAFAPRESDPRIGAPHNRMQRVVLLSLLGVVNVSGCGCYWSTSVHECDCTIAEADCVGGGGSGGIWLASGCSCACTATASPSVAAPSSPPAAEVAHVQEKVANSLTDATASSQPPSPPPPPHASEELSTGVIVGMAAGSACAVLILVLMIVMCIVYVRMGKARRPAVQALETV